MIGQKMKSRMCIIIFRRNWWLCTVGYCPVGYSPGGYCPLGYYPVGKYCPRQNWAIEPVGYHPFSD
jgi:hypothetical protein